MAKTTKKSTPKKTTRRKSTSAKESPRNQKKKPTSRTAKKKSSTATTRKAAARKKTAGETEVTVDRRRGERRTSSKPAATEQRKIERREKVTRRRQIDPTTCERDYSDDEVEFMNALDNYKRASGRMFPTCSEILEVIRKLGYAKMPITQVESQATHGPEAENHAEELPNLEGGEDSDDVNSDVYAGEEVFA